MSCRVRPILFCAGLGLVSLSGCMVPKSQLDACHAYNCQMQRRNQQICGQLENLRVQNQELANKNLDLEDKLAEQDQMLGGYQRRASEWDRERDDLRGRFASSLDGSRGPLPSRVRYRLEDFAQRYPEFVEVDAETGISKFKSDVLFDLGQARLRPEAESMLREFASIFQDPTGKALQIAVVGHTDTLQIKRPETKAKYESNWDLSTDRANTVVKYLISSGIEPRRLVSMGYGEHQPIASGRTTDVLTKNRRVEIWVLAPDAPMVGRTNRPGAY